MMLNRTKSGIFVVAVIALFFIISVVIGATSVDTTAIVDEQPAEINEGNGSVTVIEEDISPKPFMGDIIRQSSLNWADYAEVAAPEQTLPKSSIDEKLLQEEDTNWINYVDYIEANTQAYELPESGANGKPY